MLLSGEILFDIKDERFFLLIVSSKMMVDILAGDVGDDGVGGVLRLPFIGTPVVGVFITTLAGPTVTIRGSGCSTNPEVCCGIPVCRKDGVDGVNTKVDGMACGGPTVNEAGGRETGKLTVVNVVIGLVWTDGTDGDMVGPGPNGNGGRLVSQTEHSATAGSLINVHAGQVHSLRAVVANVVINDGSSSSGGGPLFDLLIHDGDGDDDDDDNDDGVAIGVVWFAWIIDGGLLTVVGKGGGDAIVEGEGGGRVTTWVAFGIHAATGDAWTLNANALLEAAPPIPTPSIGRAAAAVTVGVDFDTSVCDRDVGVEDGWSTSWSMLATQMIWWSFIKWRTIPGSPQLSQLTNSNSSLLLPIPDDDDDDVVVRWSLIVSRGEVSSNRWLQ
jgi:hypothetical protein